MFSINKFLNRIADKNQLSPTSPDSEELPTADEETTAEGFLCPTCMLAFPNPETLQNHYESSHIEDSHEQQRGQFICPACKMRLGSDIELQSHYTRHHTENKMRNGDLSSLKQELSELYTSLKEEKWYSDELKKEVLRLQTIVTNRSDAADVPQVENEMLRSQNRILEESKNLAVSELFLLRQQLEETKEIGRGTLKDKEAREQKAALLAGELADMKAKCDEMTSEKAALEYRVTVQEEEIDQLNSEVQQGTGVEDVNVLKGELASIQMMMDEMSIAKQTEKENFEEQFLLLRKQLEDLAAVNRDLDAKLKNAPTFEELDRLRAVQTASAQENDRSLELKNALNVAQAELLEVKGHLTEKDAEIEKLSAMVAENSSRFEEHSTELQRRVENLSSENAKLEEMFSQEKRRFQNEKTLLKAEMEQLDHSLKVSWSESEEIKLELSNLQSRYQEECALASELKVQILEKTNKSEQTEEHLQRRLSELQSELQKAKETTERLESERLRLYEQIEQGEGANTAIQQLQEEKLSLQEQLAEQVSTLAKHKEDYQLQVQNSNSQINELKVELQNNRDKMERADEETKDLKLKLNAGREKSQQLEKELRAKSDAMAAAEAGFNGLRSDLVQQLKVAQATLDEKDKQAAAHEQKMTQQLTSISSKQRAECIRLTTLLKKETEKAERLESDSAEISSQLANKKEQVLGLTKDKENLNQTVNHLKGVEATLLKREEEFVVKNNEWNEMRARLETQLEERTKEIEKILENQEKMQVHLVERASELSRLQNLKQQLEHKLEETSCHLRDQTDSYQQMETKLFETEERLRDERSNKEDSQHKVETFTRDLLESQKERKQLTAALENLREVKQELSEKILQLDGQARDAEKAKTEVEEAKKLLEFDLEESKRNLHQLQEQITTLHEQCHLSKQELQDTKEILLGQKAELSKHLENVMEEKDAALRDHLTKEDSFRRREQQLEDDFQELQTELEHQKCRQKEMERQREDNESRYQAQLNVLNENLGTLREDLRGEQLLRESVETKFEQCSGDKLELEAKLENALDERRGLLERCLKSEDECDKLRTTTMELRRKLDDAQGALHELGRENQALQIENTKLMNRKWADDSDVTNCMTCRKGFTVTVRKHHCRNCGGIFCNECSTKTATIAAFKKPVRVCENCYAEVTK